jgi:AcrR family transcriptional regulator
VAATPAVSLPGEIERPPAPPERSERLAGIVAAARKVLEEEGPAALTMRRLGAELGMKAPSLYKHLPGKGAIEAELITDALFDFGDVSHAAIRERRWGSSLHSLMVAYRSYCLANANLYRLATAGPLHRQRLPEGLEEWAGNPWYVVTGDPALAQALWSFAHGMVILELDDRYPPGSNLDATWKAGADAFERASIRRSSPSSSPTG